MGREPVVGPVPGLWRRMACMLYEALLLFGVSLVPAALGTALLAVPALRLQGHRFGVLEALCFLTYAAYFTWFWSRQGQTLPMKTWRIRLVRSDGGPVTWSTALLRFVAACAFFAPAWVLSRVNGWQGIDALVAQAIGLVAYTLLTLLHPQRQFWHDQLCGTRLVSEPAKA